MFKRFSATLQHYALITTKFNCTCMTYIADRTQKHCRLCMHADVLIMHAHFALEIVFYIFNTFYVPIPISITLCFVLFRL